MILDWCQDSIQGMKEPSNPASPWTGSPTAKAKNAVQREVVSLLDELAPEKVLKRGDQLRLPVEQHRTPSGCVLQAEKAAVSVSWFAAGGTATTMGELHIVVWRGTLSQRGAASRHKGATIVEELVFLPITQPTTQPTAEPSAQPTSESVWRGVDGKEYDTPALAARCLSLLKEQVDAADSA
jgi:hypothetical protein